MALRQILGAGFLLLCLIFAVSLHRSSTLVDAHTSPLAAAAPTTPSAATPSRSPEAALGTAAPPVDTQVKQAAASVAPPPPPPVTSSPPVRFGASLTLHYADGDAVTWPRGAVRRVRQALYGGGALKTPCRAVPYGEAESTRHCWGKQVRCTAYAHVVKRVTAAAAAAEGETWWVGAKALGPGGCGAEHKQVLELVVEVDVGSVTGGAPELPAFTAAGDCSGNADSVGHRLSVAGLTPLCRCRAHFAGERCGQCAEGYVDYPFCIAPPFFMDVVPRAPDDAGDHACPAGLVEFKCDMEKYPRALKQENAYAGNMAVQGCALAALPWGCELGAKRTRVKSLCTLVTAEFVGAHLVLLLESVRVFAPEVPFVVGVDRAAWATLVPALRSTFEKRMKIEFVALGHTSGAAFWFHEKPQMMQKALQRYENTLWLDADTVLLAPLGDMPAASAATFGVALHDPRGWGSGFISAVNGHVNTGVVFATNTSEHVAAWEKTIRRFDRLLTPVKKEVWQGMEEPYLDQGPADIMLTAVKGGFRLEPQWNAGWWTPEKTIEDDGRPNWWVGQNSAARIRLSEARDAILMDGAPLRVAHSHFVRQEKHYGALDQPFNDLIYNLTQDADPASLLGKFAPRFARYATHLSHPSKDAVYPKKLTLSFLETVKDWE